MTDASTIQLSIKKTDTGWWCHCCSGRQIDVGKYFSRGFVVEAETIRGLLAHVADEIEFSKDLREDMKCS